MEPPRIISSYTSRVHSGSHDASKALSLAAFTRKHRYQSSKLFLIFIIFLGNELTREFIIYYELKIDLNCVNFTLLLIFLL